MNLQQVINDTKYSVRTQISLSPSLYQLLKEQARREEKSMAEIIREKVVIQLKKEEQKKVADKKELERLANLVHTIKGNSGWEKVKNPTALIRKWRREEDEKRMKRIGLIQ